MVVLALAQLLATAGLVGYAGNALTKGDAVSAELAGSAAPVGGGGSSSRSPPPAAAAAPAAASAPAAAPASSSRASPAPAAAGGAAAAGAAAAAATAAAAAPSTSRGAMAIEGGGPTSAAATPPATLPAAPPRPPMSKLQSVEWLNDLLATLWPYMSPAIEATVQTQVQPMVADMLPGPLKKISFDRVHLGAKPLRLENIGVAVARGDALSLGVDIVFEQAAGSKPGKADGDNLDVEISLPGVKVGVEDVALVGRLGVRLVPLLAEPPFFGALEIHFVDHPELKLNFTGVGNIIDGPLVGSAVRKCIRNVVAGMMVLPNRMLVPMTPKFDLFHSYTPPAGALALHIVGAKGFKKSRLKIRNPDIYCKTTVGLVTRKTEVADNQADPVFEGSRHHFLICNRQQHVEVELMDEDTGKDDLMADLRLTTAALLASPDAAHPVRALDDKTPPGVTCHLRAALHPFSPTGAVDAACGVAVLVAGASGLGAVTATSASITVGSGKAKAGLVKATAVVMKPAKPLPGAPIIDPAAPAWNTVADFLVDGGVAAAGAVVVDVKNKGKSIGKISVDVAAVAAAPDRTVGGHMELPGVPGAKVHMKIIVHGLAAPVAA